MSEDLARENSRALIGLSITDVFQNLIKAENLEKKSDIEGSIQIIDDGEKRKTTKRKKKTLVFKELTKSDDEKNKAPWETVFENLMSIPEHREKILLQAKESLQSLGENERELYLQKKKTDCDRLNLENYVFEDFLLNNEKALLDEMDSEINWGLQTPENCLKAFTQFMRGSFWTERNTRLNLNTRWDLAWRVIEKMHETTIKFKEKAHRTKWSLKAEVEEMEIQKSELEETLKYFEQSVVFEGYDSIVKKIAAEKFVRFIKDWIKSAQLTIDRMRLRVSTSKSKYLKLSNLLDHKYEAGKNIQISDFEKLHIENTYLLKKIAQKNSHLLEVKRNYGEANLILNQLRNFLQPQMKELSTIKEKIGNCRKAITNSETEYDKVSKELDIAVKELEKLKELIDNYKVPDALDYLKLKDELSKLTKSHKVWTRKNNVIQFELDKRIRECTTLAGEDAVNFIISKVEAEEPYSDTDVLLHSKKYKLPTKDDSNFIFLKLNLNQHNSNKNLDE